MSKNMSKLLHALNKPPFPSHTNGLAVTQGMARRQRGGAGNCRPPQWGTQGDKEAGSSWNPGPPE